MLAKVIQIRGIEAERVESRLQRTCHPSGIRSIGVDFPPFGMVFRHIVVDPGGQIDGNIDVDLLAGVHLGAEEVEFEIRVHHPDFGRMIAHPMVTEGEASDGIDMRGFKPFLPLLFVEPFSDSRNIGRRVKIQMNLSETKFVHKTPSLQV